MGSNKQTGFTPLETRTPHVNNSQLRKSLTGFTIIELLIATVVFSLVLLLISNGVIQSGRLFHKGVTISNTQEVTRVIIDDVSQAIQFSVGTVTPIAASPDGNSRGICAGGKRYSYVTGLQLTDSLIPPPGKSRHVLLVDDLPACNGSTKAQDMTSPLAGSRELVGLNMRLAKFEVACVEISPGTCMPGLYNITVRVVYGDRDLLEDTLDKCRGGAGSQFCSASELTTTVQKRKQ